MEDKKNKPVPEKNIKKLTGKSATGKPLDGIEINPQLDDKRRTNEDFAVLTASLQERKALTIAQRQQRARQLKRIEPKLKRAKEISQGRLAGPKKLQARAEAKARAFLKKRFSARKDIPYAELTTAEKIQVDTAVAKKTKLIKRLAARLLPKLRKAEFERLKSFHGGAPMKSLHTVVASEEFSGLFNDLNEKSTLELVDIIENAINKFEKENNPIGITLRKMLNTTVGTDSITETLIKKSEKTGIPFSTLKEVFERGASLYEDESHQTREQIAFNRVNSYIAKGRAWTLDADLREEKIVNEELDASFNNVLEGLWANIHAKRERIKRGSGERMRKPGSKGAPTAAAIKSAQESYQDLPWKEDPKNPSRKIGAHKDEYGNKIKNYAKHLAKKAMKNVTQEAKEIVDRPPPDHKTKRRHQELQKKIVDESNNTPYVKPFSEKGSTVQRGWKASNKHGKVKFFGMDYKAAAHKHAGISEATIKSNKDGSSGGRGQTFSSASPNSYKIVNNKGEHLATAMNMKDPKYGGRTTHWHVAWHKDRHKDHPTSFQYMHQLKKHVKELDEEVYVEDTASNREIGTDSLTKKYKKDTPGQEKSDLNETFNMAWTAGIGVTLSAEECGIKIKPGFELHPDVVDAMEEVRSADVEGTVVRTASGKTVVRKQKRNKKIIGSGNVNDGKPDDTL